MNTIAIRNARHDDAGFIVHMIRRMVTDMAGYGGHAPATDEAAWDKLTVVVADSLKGNDTKYVIAEAADGRPVGAAGAELVTLGGAFAPKTMLHISAVYVLPQFRRRGIGGALLARLVDWGREADCGQCQLNVLSDNPARSLYQKNGFSVREVKMVRSLLSGE